MGLNDSLWFVEYFLGGSSLGLLGLKGSMASKKQEVQTDGLAWQAGEAPRKCGDSIVWGDGNEDQND